VAATTGFPQSAKMSVAGYFEWVGWNATFDAFTGKTYLTSVAAGVDGAGLGEAGAGPAAAGADVAGAGPDGDSGADDVAGVTNRGVAAVSTSAGEPPQAARQAAETERPAMVRSGRTEQS
jgi:hypothetical protein